MLKKLWNDPVFSKVIASVIVGIGVLLGTYFLNLWPTIGHIVDLNEDKTHSDSEKRKVVRGDSEVAKLVEPPASKSKQPTSVAPPLKQSGSEPGSNTQATPTAPPPPPPETKQPEAEKPCEQSLVGLTRPPEKFFSTWRSVVKSLPKESLIYDLLSLFKVRGRITRGHTGKDKIHEALFTLNCMETRGELRLEKLGTTGRYWGEEFENQMIVFRNP